ARTGQGGSTVIARTWRGDITVRPDAASRMASLSKGVEVVDKPQPASSDANDAGLPASAPTSVDGIRLGEDVLKLQARLVNLNVHLTDANGKTLPSLKKEDFVVYEDNVRQDVSHFEPVTAPLNIVLLLDLSGSTEHKMKVMKKAAKKFVDSLNPGDNIAVAGF